MATSIDSVVDVQRSTTADDYAAIYLTQTTTAESYYNTPLITNPLLPTMQRLDATPTDVSAEDADVEEDEGEDIGNDEDAPLATAGPGAGPGAGPRWGWPPPPPPPGWPTGFPFPPPPPPGVTGPPPPAPSGWPSNYPWPPPPPPPPPPGWWGGRGRRRRRKKHSSTDPSATPTDSASVTDTTVPTDSMSMTPDPTATLNSPTPISSMDSLLPSSTFISESPSPTDTSAPTVGRGGPHIGALVGGIVGGLVGAGVVGALAFFCMRRAKRKNRKSMSSDSNGSNDMYQYTTDGQPSTFAETIPSSALGVGVGARAFVPPATKSEYGPDAYAGPQSAPPAQEDMYYYSPYSPTSPRFSQPNDNVDAYSHTGGYYNSFPNPSDPTTDYTMPGNPYYANYSTQHVAAANTNNGYYSSNYYDGSQIGGGSSEGYSEPFADAMPSTTALVSGAAAAAGTGVAVGAAVHNAHSPTSASDIDNRSAIQSVGHDNTIETAPSDTLNHQANQTVSDDNVINTACDTSVSVDGTTAVGSVSAGRPSMSDATHDKTYFNPDDPDKPRVVVSKPDAKDD